MEDATATAGGVDADGTEGTEAPNSLDQALGTEGELIEEIEQSLTTHPEQGPRATKLELEELQARETDAKSMRDLDLLSDVEVEVAVEFGRTRIPLRRLLTLRRGALVELGRRPEQQVTVLANGTPIALGDVVVVDDQVGVHIVELIDPKSPAPIAADEASLPMTEVREPEVGPAAAEVAGAQAATAVDEETRADGSDAGASGESDGD